MPFKLSELEAANLDAETTRWVRRVYEELLAGQGGGGFDPTKQVVEKTFEDLARTVVAGDGNIVQNGYILQASGGAQAQVLLSKFTGLTSPSFGVAHAKLTVDDANDVSTVLFGGLPFLVGHDTGQGDGLSFIVRMGVSPVAFGAGHTFVGHLGLIDHNLTSGNVGGGFGLKLDVDDTGARVVGWANDSFATVVTATPAVFAVDTAYWFKVEVTGTSLQFSYSEDGVVWRPIGAAVSVAALIDFGNIPTGFFVEKTLGANSTLNVYVDYFKVSVPYAILGGIPS